jgi:hypothetical protein
MKNKKFGIPKRLHFGTTALALGQVRGKPRPVAEMRHGHSQPFWEEP